MQFTWNYSFFAKCRARRGDKHACSAFSSGFRSRPSSIFETHAFVSRSLSQLGFALLFYDWNVTNRRGRKERNMWFGTKRGRCRVSFLRWSFLFSIQWHSLNPSFVPSLRLHGEQAQVSGEGGQVGRKGQEQGAGRSSETAGGKEHRQGYWYLQARAVRGGSQAQAKPSRRASRVRVAYLVDGDWQTKHLN